MPLKVQISKIISKNKFWGELISYFPLIQKGPHRKPNIRGGHKHRDSKVIS
jgi:hypothetical protein